MSLKILFLNVKDKNAIYPTTPGTSVDNTIARWDGTNGKMLQGSTVVVTDNGDMKIPSTATLGLQLYNTVDQVTNYERLEALFVSNVARIRSVNGGTGTLRELILSAGSTNSFSIRPSPATDGEFRFTGQQITIASGQILAVVGTNTATSGTSVGIALTPTYNQASGTAANTDLLINRTETAVGSGAQYLIQAQTGGTDRFRVANTGDAYISNKIAAGTTDFTPKLNLSGGISTTAWGVSGVRVRVNAATDTDTSTAGSGTAATAVFTSLGQPTLAATNSTVTTTDAATLYIANAPANGTNMTITNPYSLWIAAGDIRYDGTVSASVATASTNKVRINCGGTTYYLLMTTVP